MFYQVALVDQEFQAFQLFQQVQLLQEDREVLVALEDKNIVQEIRGLVLDEGLDGFPEKS